MNDRKRAWQIVHNEILRRATLDTTDDGIRLDQVDAILDQVDDDYDLVMQLTLVRFDPTAAAARADDFRWSGSVITSARSGLSDSSLAGFAAIFALMHRDPESARRLADQIGARVMNEPDYPE
ncbi:hypothetical protein [Mycolicibacterium porcinum]|uniref:hypothetical protein n=1 Tax=Mycolicibacterium porcinum TaxID=39693 RepID=UPI0008487DB5|nr:hypothetical protein [Mycolicibacterium porcinum]ODR22125.1 hypothetical protein BHQ19_19810 [Mycolicibacterium porcinum]